MKQVVFYRFKVELVASSRDSETLLVIEILQKGNLLYGKARITLGIIKVHS